MLFATTMVCGGDGRRMPVVWLAMGPGGSEPSIRSTSLVPMVLLVTR